MTQTLVDHRGRPIAPSRVSAPSRDSGSLRGIISNYLPHRVLSQYGEDAERALTIDRAEDLYANDFAAKSTVDTIALNAVGTGLTPQPRIPFQRLGITEDEAYDIKEQMEWNWEIWCRQAHALGPMHFEDLELAGITSLLRAGALVQLPLMEQSTDAMRPFSLGLQPLSPKRLRTPSDLQSNPCVRGGVQLSKKGKLEGYWIASPAPSSYSAVGYDRANSLSSQNFRFVPAKVGHRPGLFHVFRYGDEDEQVRGVSSLSASVKLYRTMGDAIDYELLAQVIAASFPVFIGMEGGRSGLPAEVMDNFGIPHAASHEGDPREYQTVDPGQVLYGKPGEIPHVLESKRPSANFMAFEELVLRAAFAANGLSLEAGLKNFSKSNYSAIRAALNEDWKTYMLYRSLFHRQYCHPLYIMVQEEAYLRGMLTLPAHGLDFYDALHLWTNAYWYGPSRGYVDPVKEIQANLMAISNRLMTRTEHWAQHGGDFWEGMDQIEAEEKRISRMPSYPETVNVSKAVKTVDPAQELSGGKGEEASE